jgi:hypothetical protein
MNLAKLGILPAMREEASKFCGTEQKKTGRIALPVFDHINFK